MDFDQLKKDKRISDFLESQFLKGNYHMLSQNNEGRWGVSIGGRFFTNPFDLTAFKRSSGFRREDVISTSPKDRAGRLLESKLGPQRYFGLESLMRRASSSNPKYSGIKVFRESYGVREGGVASLSEQLTQNGKQIGFIVPDDESTTVLRVVNAAGVDLTTEEIEEMMGKVGYTIYGERMGTDSAKRAVENLVSAGREGKKDLAKLMKRLKVISNIEMFGLEESSSFKAAVLSQSQAKNLYAGLLAESGSQYQEIFRALGATGANADSMFEGFSLLNPAVIRRAIDQMAEDLEDTEKYFRTANISPTDPSYKAVAMTISKKKEELKEMEEILARGGRLQDFRMRGFDIDYLKTHAQALGFNPGDPDDMRRLEALASAMIKGDVGIIAESQWAERAKAISRYLGFDVSDMDVLSYAGNFASQFGYMPNTGGSLTFKPTSVKGVGRVDSQFLSSFPEMFGFQELSEYNQNMFKTWMENLSDPAKSAIPSEYKEMLERLVGMTEVKSKSDIEYLTRLFGQKDAMSLEIAYRQQRQKAINILTLEKAGFTPATNRQMFKEIGEGLIEMMQKSQAKPDELFGFTPMSAQAHVTSDFWAKLMGIKTAGPGQATFDPKVGLIYSGLDAAELMEIHGGGDFDDLIQMMLRWDPKKKTFMFVNRRSPGGLGEVLGIQVPEDSVLRYGKTLLKQSDYNQGLYSGLIREVDLELENNPALRASLGSSIADMDNPEKYLQKWLKDATRDKKNLERNFQSNKTLMDAWANRRSFLNRISQKIQEGNKLSKSEISKLERMLTDIPGGKIINEENALIRELLLHAKYRPEALFQKAGRTVSDLEQLQADYLSSVGSRIRKHSRGFKNIPLHLDQLNDEIRKVRDLREILTGTSTRETSWDQAIMRAIASSVPELGEEVSDELLRQGIYLVNGEKLGSRATPDFLKTLTDQQLEWMTNRAKLDDVIAGGAQYSPAEVQAATAFRDLLNKEDALLKSYGGVIDIPEFKNLEDILSPQALAAMTPVSRQAFEAANRAEQTKHALGSYSMLREWVDQIARQVEDQGLPISGSVMPFKQETVIDLLVQGAYKNIGLDPDAVNRRTYAMLASISDMVANDGLKLDPARLQGLRSAGLHRPLTQMLKSRGIDISTVADDTGEDLATIMTRASQMQKENRRKYKGLFSEAYSEIPEYDFIDRHFFSERALSDAQTLSDAFNSGWDSAKMGIGVFTPEEQIDMFGELLEPDMDHFMVNSARTEMRKALASMFEQNSSGKLIMGSRAKEALGAYMQKHGTAGTKEARALLGQELSDATLQTLIHFAKIHPNSDSARLLAQMDMKSTRPITQEQVLTGIDDFAPGSQQQAMGAKAYAHAKGVIDNIKGPQGWKVLGDGGMIASLMDKPIFKRGAIAAGLLAGGSVLYRKLTDRSPEDMQGPPMLPGGGFYEDMPQTPAPQVGNQYVPPNTGGVTYRIQARGNFSPNELAQQAQLISGGSVTGSSYSAPRYGFKKQSPFDALSSGGF